MKSPEILIYCITLALSGCATQRDVQRVLDENQQLKDDVAELAAAVSESMKYTHDRIDYVQVQWMLDKMIPQTIPLIAKIAEATHNGKEKTGDINWNLGLDNGKLVSIVVSFDGKEFKVKNIKVTDPEGNELRTSFQIEHLPEKIEPQLNSIFQGFMNNMERNEFQNAPNNYKI